MGLDFREKFRVQGKALHQGMILGFVVWGLGIGGGWVEDSGRSV